MVISLSGTISPDPSLADDHNDDVLDNVTSNSVTVFQVKAVV
jgi:hypothetical protein